MYFTTMPRLAVRRAPGSDSHRSESRTLPILLGPPRGVAAGFVLGELLGPVATRTIRGGGVPLPGVPARRLVVELVELAQAALDDDLVLRGAHLSVVGVGDGRIELHGWLADRRARTHAAHLVRGAVVADQII